MAKSASKALVIVSMSLLSIASGVRHPEAWADAKPAKPTKEQAVTFALDWTPNTNHVGLYVAANRKMFAAEKLKVTFVQPKQSITTQLVASGAAAFGVSFANDVILAREQGVPVVAIAAIIQHNTSCFAWRKETGIKGLKDFEGKRYGGWGSPEEAATLKYLMTKNGADFSKLKIVTTGVSDFVSTTPKNADIMWIYKGWDGVQAKLAGVAIDTLCLKDLDPVFDHPSPFIITSEKLIAENPALVKAFLAAASKGYQASQQDPGAAATDLLAQVPELDPTLTRESMKVLAGEYAKGASRWGEQKKEVWSRYLDWMRAEGLIKKNTDKKNVDTNALFTNAFLPGK